MLFLNMRIWEIWYVIDEVHNSIFNSDNIFICRSWLSVCELSSKTDLKSQLTKEYKVKDLQECWASAFGGYESSKARKLLKYMMLFMTFGADMPDLKRLLNNGYLSEFFTKFPVRDGRTWAFKTCFGVKDDWQTIKAKVSKVVRQSP